MVYAWFTQVYAGYAQGNLLMFRSGCSSDELGGSESGGDVMLR